MTATTVFTAIAGIIALVAIGIYFFGIPPEAKREMERQALRITGENKTSYVAKGSLKPVISKKPTANICQTKLISFQHLINKT